MSHCLDIDALRVETVPKAYDDPFKVTLDDENDQFSPRNLPSLRKWRLVFTVCAAIICVTCTSSIYSTTYAQLNRGFAATKVTCALGLSTFVLGIALGGLITGPLSENFGRRRIYLVSWSMFMIWTIPSAVAQNMTTLITTRLFGGFFGSTFLSVAGGTVADIFAHDQLQKPMLFVSLAPFVGPACGPLVGGFINSHLHWRWTYYIILIWSSIILVAVALMPETFHPLICISKAQKLRMETSDHHYRASAEKKSTACRRTTSLVLLRPFQLLFLEPMCLCLNIYSAILLGILYIFFGTLPQIFRTNHGMNLWQSGLIFLAIIVGMLLGVATSPIWVRIRSWLISRHQIETGVSKRSEPEYRLPPMMAGGVLIPIGLFWFAWTTQESIHWIVPVLACLVFGLGVNLVFNGIFTFLVEAYSQFAASALASNSFATAFLAAAFPLVQIPMFDRLGFHWGISVLAFLTMAMIPFPWLFFKYGKSLRSKSRFATSSQG
ncbi:major facilitator superfamily domain-containing protein [Dactylonectria macrodidyma]|uniref:Major facilitator superfamily domain-containing protein n=1 Tax=Dactylonectria macrodidyma TaxID=307937 RepID=A0A9P9DZ17_9HYPO|nr:major facilitator superfamily domain-containing protein [Dactylonectria macrodidyma]